VSGRGQILGGRDLVHVSLCLSFDLTSLLPPGLISACGYLGVQH